MYPRAIAVLCLFAALTLNAAAAAENPVDRGAALLEQGKVAEARAYFENLSRANPNNPSALYWLGRAIFADGDAAKAGQQFEKALALKPGSSEFHLWLGRAYGQQALRANPFSQASLARKVKAEFEKAVELDPNNLDARSGLIEFYAMAPGIIGGSEEKARLQAAEIGRRDAVEGVRATARIHMLKQRWDEAERAYVDGIRSHGGNRDLRRDLGLYYQQRKEWQKAYRIFSSLVAEDGSDMAAHYQIGRTAVLSGQFLDAGEQSLQKYLGGYVPKTGEPPLKWAHVRLGSIYEKKNRADLARISYGQALKLDAAMKEAKEALARLR